MKKWEMVFWGAVIVQTIFFYFILPEARVTVLNHFLCLVLGRLIWEVAGPRIVEQLNKFRR